MCVLGCLQTQSNRLSMSVKEGSPVVFFVCCLEKDMSFAAKQTL